MTGARGGVIGVKREQSIAVFRSHMPMRYDAADEDPWLMAVVIRTSSGSQPSRAESIEAIVRPESSATSASGRNQTR
jgi:calcineurin-like phosphoesterase